MAMTTFSLGCSGRQGPNPVRNHDPAARAFGLFAERRNLLIQVEVLQLTKSFIFGGR